MYVVCHIWIRSDSFEEVVPFKNRKYGFQISFQFRFIEAGDNEARAGLQTAGGFNLHIFGTFKLVRRRAKIFLRYVKIIHIFRSDRFSSVYIVSK